MRPDDANIVGNVHGGIILKMIEEAGCIVGTRHCNTQNGVRGNSKPQSCIVDSGPVVVSLYQSDWRQVDLSYNINLFYSAIFCGAINVNCSINIITLHYSLIHVSFMVLFLSLACDGLLLCSKELNVYRA